MKRRKLQKLAKELERLRRSPQKAKALQALASRLGRKLRGGAKHPMWVNTEFKLPPLAIPDHKGRDIPPGTKSSILNQLEEDLAAWELRVEDDSSDEFVEVAEVYGLEDTRNEDDDDDDDDATAEGGENG
jgi:hypothetical protein